MSLPYVWLSYFVEKTCFWFCRPLPGPFASCALCCPPPVAASPDCAAAFTCPSRPCNRTGWWSRRCGSPRARSTSGLGARRSTAASRRPWSSACRSTSPQPLGTCWTWGTGAVAQPACEQCRRAALKDTPVLCCVEDRAQGPLWVPSPAVPLQLLSVTLQPASVPLDRCAPTVTAVGFPSKYRRGGNFGRCEIRDGEMWHSKIVAHFAVVFKDRSQVLAFPRSVHIFSPLQGSEGLNCRASCSVDDHDHGQVMGGPGNNSNHPEYTWKQQQPSRVHQEITATIQSTPGNNSNHPEYTRK